MVRTDCIMHQQASKNTAVQCTWRGRSAGWQRSIITERTPAFPIKCHIIFDRTLKSTRIYMSPDTHKLCVCSECIPTTSIHSDYFSLTHIFYLIWSTSHAVYGHPFCENVEIEKKPETHFMLFNKIFNSKSWTIGVCVRVRACACLWALKKIEVKLKQWLLFKMNVSVCVCGCV